MDYIMLEECPGCAVNANDIKHLQNSNEEIRQTYQRTFALIDNIKNDVNVISNNQERFIGTVNTYMEKNEKRIDDLEQENKAHGSKIGILNGKFWGIGIMTSTLVSGLVAAAFYLIHNYDK